MKSARRSAVLIAASLGASVAILSAMGCSKIFSYAVDRAMGDDASVTEALTSGSGSGSGKNACDLVTDAEIEAASGKKIV
ncbi:MAG: hypothetical protein ABI461_01025, partial [Polyangiaceae bacterium]